MNETAPIKDNSALKATMINREKGNKTMKKMHSKSTRIHAEETDPNFHLLKPIPKQKKKTKSKENGDDYQK